MPVCGVDVEDVTSRGGVRRGEVQLAVEPTGASQRRVNRIQAICCTYHYHFSSKTDNNYLGEIYYFPNINKFLTLLSRPRLQIFYMKNRKTLLAGYLNSSYKIRKSRCDSKIIKLAAES